MESLIENKKARFNYEFLETFEAGLKLLGFEVKSLRSRHGSLDGAYVIVRGAEAFITGMQIPPFQVNNTPKEYDPERLRKLILSKKEIAHLAVIENKKGLTIVPINVYNKGDKLKVSIAVARGKREFDKRDIIKKRETDREIHRTLKSE